MRTKLLSVLTLMLFAQISGFGQDNCPTSPFPGIHVVQPGENLYRVSKKYGISVADICTWNRISENSILPRCAELYIAAPKQAVKKDEPLPGPSAFAPAESAILRQNDADRQHQPLAADT